MNNMEWLSKGFAKEGLPNGIASLDQSTVVDNRLSHKCGSGAEGSLMTMVLTKL